LETAPTEDGLASTAITAQMAKDGPAAMWYYGDIHGEVEGPFTTEKMQSWVNLGHLEPSTLVVRYGDSGLFRPMTAAFPLTAARDGEWHYLDLSDTVQGPFSTAKITQWVETKEINPLKLKVQYAERPMLARCQCCDHTGIEQALSVLKRFEMLDELFPCRETADQAYGNPARQIKSRYKHPDDSAVDDAYHVERHVFQPHDFRSGVCGLCMQPKSLHTIQVEPVIKASGNGHSAEEQKQGLCAELASKCGACVLM